MANKFDYVKKGYDPVSVDIFIEKLEEELNQYKKKDGAINKAIINAQMAANSIIDNAKDQGKAIKANSARQIQDIVVRLSEHKAVLENLNKDYNDLLSKYMRPISESDFADLADKIDISEHFLKDLAIQIEEEMELEEEIIKIPAKPNYDDFDKLEADI